MAVSGMSELVDRRRTQAIADFDVLHHAPRLELLAVVELAAQVCHTPMATINLITDIEQHQVATYGFDASICRREDSMCAGVLDAVGAVVVPDASLDDRFRDNPFVTGILGDVRFYASRKLVTKDEITIGTLCVFDTVARDLDAAQVTALDTLADRIVDVLELSLRSRQLAASNDRLATFAGRVSHDLKTPLSTMSLALETLHEMLESDAGPDQLDGVLRRAIKGSERMAALIDQVLAYASLSGGLVLEPVRLNRLLTEVLDDLGPELGGVNMSLGALPTVSGDQVQLRSLLQNLLGNASKYRRPDRTLSLEIDAARRGPMWRITVSDNGRGIPAAERERVFEPRVRLDDDDAGSGIGLDTCRRVVQAHGGSIGAVESRSGGTTIWFEIPA